MIGTPTTPTYTTPSSTPVTPTNLNVPSPLMKQPLSPVGSSVPGPLMATQQPKELACQPTNHQTLTSKNLTSSQMRQQLPLPVVAATIPLVAQEPSPVTSCIGTTTVTLEPKSQYTPMSVSAGISSVPQPNVRKRSVTPTSTKEFQFSTKPSPVIKSTSSLESTQSHKVSAKAAQNLSPAVALQPTPAPRLTDWQTNSTTVDTASKVPTEQPSKSIQPRDLALSNTPIVHSANIQHSSTPVAAKQLMITSVSQPQIQPTKSPIHPLTLQQAVTMMGMPLCNLPLHLQQVYSQVPITAVSSQSGSVLMQNIADKQSETRTMVRSIPTQSKPQQSIVDKSSSAKASQSATATGGTKSQRLLTNPTISNKLPPVSVMNNCASQGGVVEMQKVLSKSQTLEYANSCPTTNPNNSSSTKRVTTVNTVKVCKTASLKGEKTSPQQVELPLCSNSSSMTSKNPGSIQTATSSPRSATQDIPQVSTPAKRALTFSNSVTTSSKTNSDVLQTTSFSSSNTCIVQSAPTSSMGVELKLLKRADAYGPTSTCKFTAASSSQKEAVNTIRSFPCTVCQHTPRNPLRSECCGVLYCEPCSKRADKCPQHLCQLNFKRDIGLFNLIQRKQTKCRYVGNGCTWTGLVAKQWEHITACPFNPSSELLVYYIIIFIETSLG